jgi:hypothetical protein
MIPKLLGRPRFELGETVLAKARLFHVERSKRRFEGVLRYRPAGAPTGFRQGVPAIVISSTAGADKFRGAVSVWFGV